MLQKGEKAPDFELYATPDQKIKLSELKGKKQSSLFILRIGARFAVIKWHCIMKR